MQNWDEIKTAFFVAQAGTVSGAAEKLGYHHATVIRHVDALEGKLKTKLFQRHARGYTPTDAGLELMQAAQVAHERFSQLEGMIKGQSDAVEGELVITTLVTLAPRLMPLIREFQDIHPKLVVRYLAGDRLFRLEYGEAHVAIRAGDNAPDQPDNIVQHLSATKSSLFASQDYVDKYGQPSGLDDLASHRFVASSDESSRVPFYRWLNHTIDEAQISLRADDPRVAEAAVVAGIGLGFMSDDAQTRLPNLVKVAGPEPEWGSQLWLVTHMDLHRTAKVQAFSRFLKERLTS